MTATDGVRDDLRAAWSRATPAGAAGDALFEDLMARYGEPHRRYHTVAHLHDVVEGVQALSRLCSDPATTLLAAFFHDAVYVIGAADNEAASAELARETLRELGLPPSAADRVGELVIATAGHELPQDASLRDDAAVLIDADLAVLGGEPYEYSRYVERVRAEYAEIPDDLWQLGRAAVLETFLRRPTIYFTEPGRRREPQARRNLRAEHEALTGA